MDSVRGPPPHTLNSSSCAAFPKANCLLSYCRFPLTPPVVCLCKCSCILKYKHTTPISSRLVLHCSPLPEHPNTPTVSSTYLFTFTGVQPRVYIYVCTHRLALGTLYIAAHISSLGPSCTLYSLKAPTYCPQPLWVCVLHTVIPSCLPPQ